MPKYLSCESVRLKKFHRCAWQAWGGRASWYSVCRGIKKQKKVAKGQATACWVGSGRFDTYHLFRSLTLVQFQLPFGLSCLRLHWINVSNSFPIKQSQSFIPFVIASVRVWLSSGNCCCKCLLESPTYLVVITDHLFGPFSSSAWRKVVKLTARQIE